MRKYKLKVKIVSISCKVFILKISVKSSNEVGMEFLLKNKTHTIPAF